MKYKKYDSFGSIDKEKFKELILSGFNKKLTLDYFEYVNPQYICLATDKEKYCGAIVVEEFKKGLFYLDKIVVSKESQGKGVGKKLWEILNGDSKKLIWRAKSNNPINSFYTKQCTGLYKVSSWIIFWTGLNPTELESGIEYALKKKHTLEEIK